MACDDHDCVVCKEYDLSYRAAIKAQRRLEDEARMDHIGQNGGEGLHYDVCEEDRELQNEGSDLFEDVQPCLDVKCDDCNCSSQYDAVKQPKHYELDILRSDGTLVQAIDVIHAVLSEEEFRGYCKGNQLKYLLRASKKNGDEDYRKAEQYINFMFTDWSEE